MPRRPAPDLSSLGPPPEDTSQRGARITTPEELGEVVRAERARRLGRQLEAAERLGVGSGALGALERGDRGVRLDTVLRVLADLGLDVVLVPRDQRDSLQPRAHQ